MTFSDLFKLFYRHKKIIIINSLIVGLITAVIAFFFMDEIFQSTSVVKSTSKSAGLGGILPDISGLEDITGSIGGNSAAKELALYENIILSRRCVEAAIINFDLMNEYEFKKMDDMIKYFRNEIVETKIDKLAGTMSIGVFDKSPEKAKRMNEFLIEKLNNINIEMATLDAKNNREFIESRYELIKSTLKNSEDSLEMYQNQYGVAPDLQIKATAQSAFELEVEIKSEEVKLDVLKKILSPDQSEVKLQEEKINALKSQLAEINQKSYKEGDFGMKGAPEVAMNYLRLTRDVEIQNKLLTFIIPILEKSKIDENKTTPTVMVLDPPSLPDKKAKPKRSYIVIAMMFISGAVTFSFFLIKNKWVNFRSQNI